MTGADDGRASVGTTIQSAARAARLLLAIAESDRPVSARTLAERFGLTIPTTHNLIRTLAVEGLVERDGHGAYRLGPMAALIAYRVSAGSDLPAEYVAAMNRVADQTGEATYLATWRRGQVVLVDSRPSVHRLQVVMSPLDLTGSLHARATGKLMLALARPDARRAALAGVELESITPATITAPDALEAEFESIRRDGIAFDREEFVEGAWGASVPIWAGSVASACLSVHLPTDRWQQHGEAVVRVLRREAVAASRAVLAPADR